MKTFKIPAMIAMAIFLVVGLCGATFSLFSPATGVLKGSSTTYITSAAASTDIRALWSGTCNANTFLQGDGTCAAVTLTNDVAGILPVANGGTATATPALVAGTNVSITGTWPNQTINSTASGGSVAGSDTQIQFNDGGAFGADADHTWNKTTNRETVNGSVSGLDAGTVTSNGGALIVKGGTGGATSGNGGTLTLTGGDPVGSGTGGNITIFGQQGVGANNVGSTVAIQGGVSAGSGTGGNVSILAAGSVTGSAGVVNITGGAGGNTSGDAGAVNLNGGTPAAGAGGSVNITAKNGVGTNQNGGNVVITLGSATGSGTVGALQFVGGNTTGAQTATFVAANKPGAGTAGPTSWLRVVIGGTTFWIPLFGN